MAEHPGTPDPSDDDLSPAAFDGLGLGSLADDVRPTRSQWAAIEAASARRLTGRRPWLISAAAVVVLIAAVAGLLVARSGTEDVDLATGVGVGGGPDGTFLLPPEESSVIALYADQDGWYIQYMELDGHAWFLASSSISGMDPAYEGPVPLGTASQVSPFGLTYFQCSPGYVSGTARTDGTATGSGSVVSVEPVRATWGAGYPGATLVSSSDIPFWAQQPPAVEQPCLDPTEPVTSLTEQMSKLRRVSFAEWAKFLADNGEVRSTDPTAPPAPKLVEPSASTTTLVETPPADRGTAEEQIRTAVAEWNRTDADGSFPNLEAGTEKSAEYAEMFDTAAKQSGAAQAGDGSGNSNTVTSIRFVTPERAAIVMSLTAKLPTGTFTFPQDGEAILEDGRWVVTYRTVINTLRRACTPPGGYDGCPDGSTSGNGTPIVVPAN
jgi:hypothetical protein